MPRSFIVLLDTAFSSNSVHFRINTTFELTNHSKGVPHDQLRFWACEKQRRQEGIIVTFCASNSWEIARKIARIERFRLSQFDRLVGDFESKLFLAGKPLFYLKLVQNKQVSNLDRSC